MTDDNQLQQEKRAYDTPTLRTIDLLADEVLAGNCKSSAGPTEECGTMPDSAFSWGS